MVVVAVVVVVEVVVVVVVKVVVEVVVVAVVDVVVELVLMTAHQLLPWPLLGVCEPFKSFIKKNFLNKIILKIRISKVLYKNDDFYLFRVK